MAKSVTEAALQCKAQQVGEGLSRMDASFASTFLSPTSPTESKGQAKTELDP